MLFSDESILHIIHKHMTGIAKIVAGDVNHIAQYAHSSSDVQCKWRTPSYCCSCSVEENNTNVPWSSKESYYSDKSRTIISCRVGLNTGCLKGGSVVY